ncbi:MAG: hypothetical protein FPO08_19470 [Geobacter sp.]|nr:MAG: hypothetical protein FPO08_19470 [Geobacter sp.]
MKPVATIVLNRNLPEVTDRLVEKLVRNDGDLTEVFVVESGSQLDNLSKYCTWHANWPDALEHGLRVPRGFNYALCELMKAGRFKDFDYYFMLTNDTEFEEDAVLAKLLDVLAKHKRVGILSPCSRNWGEKMLLRESSTKYFWYVHNTAYLMRREFIEDVMNTEQPDYMNILYDGSNFRGYGTETELIAKGYANDWATAITTQVWSEENESYLLKQADLIKTDSYDTNIRLFVEEGKRWMRNKYGFNSRWTMQMYTKFFYEHFFEINPEFSEFKI